MEEKKKREISDLSAEDHLRLAAEKLGITGGSLSSLECGFEDATREMCRLELSRRLNEPETSGPKKCPQCGHRCGIRARDKERTIRTLSGDVSYRRNYHYCAQCSSGFYPRDDAYEIPESGEVSRELERRILDFAMNDPFAQGAERFSLHYSFSVSPNLLRRVFERVSGRLGDCDEEWIQQAMKVPEDVADSTVIVESDGSMVSTTQGWKETKLGMVYTHQDSTEDSKAKRPSPRFVASMKGTDAFEEELEQALDGHGKQRPKTVLWLGDGAAGYWNIANRVCPNAEQILDWYHAIEHAADCAKILFEETDLQALWLDVIKHQLMRPGGVARVLDELEACLFLTDGEGQQKAITHLRRYYRTHEKRMDYYRYRQNGWPIGSGSIESAHRYVLQARMKRAGQHWSHNVAAAMAKMRAHYVTAGPVSFHQAIQDAQIWTNMAA